MWCSIAETFSRTMVESVHDELEFFGRNRTKVAMLGQILSYQSIGVLTGATLPGSVGMCEVDANAEIGGDVLMVSELTTIV